MTSLLLTLTVSPPRLELELWEAETLRANREFVAWVVPGDLGWMDGPVFRPARAGRGVVVVRSGNEELAIPVVVKRPRKTLSPKAVVVRPGDTVSFRPRGGEEITGWMVVPPWLGRVRDGVFVAERPGKGTVMALTGSGAQVARVVVEGRPGPAEWEERTIFMGQVLKVPNLAGVAPRWVAEPAEGGVVGLSPGRALAWSGSGDTVLAIEVLPGVLLREGQTFRPRRGKVVKVEGRGIRLVARRRRGAALVGTGTGWGVLWIWHRGRERMIPYVVGREVGALFPPKARCRPGEALSFKLPPNSQLRVVPEGAAEIRGAQVIPTRPGPLWVLAITPEGGYMAFVDVD